MITGYNNDIKHRGTVFHVQTEDKGEASAWIESLIYTGGRILARKRVTYKQLLAEGGDKPAIAKLMERQHRLMIHQIREGRFDSETSDGLASGSQPSAEDEAQIHTTRIQQQAEAMFGPTLEAPPPEAPADVETPEGHPLREAEVVQVEAEVVKVEAEVVQVEDSPVEAKDEETESPAEPEEALAEVAQEEAEAALPETPSGDLPSDERPTPEEPLAPEPEGDEDDVQLEIGPAPTLDQVIFDYLSSVAKEESLVLLMDESPALAAGTTTRMDLGTHASRSGKPIANAMIAVRMISKTGGPVTLAEGATDEEGTLRLVVEVPEVQRDSAALIITAASSIGNAEIKHLL